MYDTSEVEMSSTFRKRGEDVCAEVACAMGAWWEESPGEAGGPAEKGLESQAEDSILYQQTGEGFMLWRQRVALCCRKTLGQS